MDNKNTADGPIGSTRVEPSASVYDDSTPDIPITAHSTSWGSLFRWYDPGMTKAEKRLVFKLDLCVMTFSCLSFFVKYLEQSCINNAWVSGLQKDLKLPADDLNWLTTYYAIGVIIGSPFAVPILTIVRPAYWLSSCVIISCLFTLFMYKAETAATLYGLRFGLGFFSSTIMAGNYHLIGSWYRKDEIYRRTAIYTASSYAGGMFGGYIQTGLNYSMQGRLGLASWRWLFIVNAIIAFPIGIFGFFCCPNDPDTPRNWWMTEEERVLSKRRLQFEYRSSYGRFDASVFRRVLGSWQLYVFPIAFGMRELTCGPEITRWMTLYLKKARYTQAEVNSIPTSVGCSEIVFSIVSSWLADWTQRPSLVIMGFSLVAIYGFAVLTAWPEHNEGWIISSYIIAGSGYCTIGPLLFAWANATCGGDQHLRAFVNGLAFCAGYIAETLAQQFIFPVAHAPAFRTTPGYSWSLGWEAGAAVFAGVVIPLFQRWLGVPQSSKGDLEEDEDADDAPSNGLIESDDVAGSRNK